jgi:DNA-binding MarR family transcriptional regulator
MAIKRPLLFMELAQTMERIMKMVEKSAKIKFEDPGVTMLQIQALNYIKSNPNTPAHNLSRKLYLSASSTSQLLDRLYEQKLITRKNDPGDRRLVLVNLTGKGGRFIEKMKKRHFEVVKNITKFMSVEEIMKMIEIHKNVAERIDKNNKFQNTKL